MKKFSLIKFVTLSALVVSLSLTVVPCLVSEVVPYLSENHQGFEYSIDEGETIWNGKDNNKYWGLDSADGKECMFNVSVLSNSYVEVTGTLKTVRPMWFDQTVKTVTVAGDSGAWNGILFNAGNGQTYYAVIKNSKKGIGCNGRVSITMP